MIISFNQVIPPAFNPHFQRHFTATLLRKQAPRPRSLFQSSFSEALHCNFVKTFYQERSKGFQSSFSEALHCNIPLINPARYGGEPFNPHFQRHFTATLCAEGGQEDHLELSILIFRGTSLQQKTPGKTFYSRLSFQSSFSEALHCNYLDVQGCLLNAIQLSILIFRGTSLQLPRHMAKKFKQYAFNPHFQRHFTATQGVSQGAGATVVFQSSFSEALHCNPRFPPRQPGEKGTFNPHFQRHFTATRFLLNLEGPPI